VRYRVGWDRVGEVHRVWLDWNHQIFLVLAWVSGKREARRQGRRRKSMGVMGV